MIKVTAIAAGQDYSLAMIDVPPAGVGPQRPRPGSHRDLPDLHVVLAWR